MFTSFYIEAYRYAITKARETRHAYGIEACSEYGRKGFRVKMIPNDPAKRFGWEMRCEPVTPEMPLL